MSNYYETLNLSKNCSEKDVREAYKNALKTYPPEKYPEEFKKIREAYEVLVDAKARTEYDAMNKYRKEIEAYMSAGGAAMEKEEYKNAVREFRKVLVIHPTYSEARNQLGLALYYDGDKESAAAQFEKLVNENPKNATYLCNLGVVYKSQQQYDKAEEVLFKAYAIDKIDTNVVTELADLHQCKEEYDKAIKVLNDAIEISGKDDFKNFVFFYKEIEVYIMSGAVDKAEKIINEVVRMMPDDKEIKEYVVWKFGRMAYQLYDANIYGLAEKIAYKAKGIDPNSEAIAELYKAAKELNELDTLLDKLLDDNRIIGPLKGPAFYYLRGDRYSEEELKEEREKNLEALQSYIDGEPRETIKSLNLLKKDYYTLYNSNKELYDLVYTKCREKTRFF